MWPLARSCVGDQHPEDALGELDVLRQQRQELVGRQRQRDRSLGGGDGARHRRSFEQLLESQRRRRRRCRGFAGRDAAVEQELDRAHQLAAFVERAALLVAHLPAEPRQAEQLIDVREIEQRHPAQAIGELDRRQRLLPELLAPIGLARDWRRAPTTPLRRRADRGHRDAPARARDRRRATTCRVPRPPESPPTRSTGPRRAAAARRVSSTSRVRVR